MKNQHRKITGYRELNQEEIDLMNKVKELGVAMEGVLKKVQEHLYKQTAPLINDELTLDEIEEHPITKHFTNATPERFLALAKTEFQTGLMYATRAVAQPEFF